MSTQLGIVYRNGAPVSDEQASIIRRSLKLAGHSAPQMWLSGNVCLGYADVQSGRKQSHPQPYVTPRASITFDGRLDNRDELSVIHRDLLRGENDDPLLALAAYQHHAIDGLGKLIGDWSLAIWNNDSQEVVLASDFAGVRPLYYSVDATRIVWSTRLKLLLDLVQVNDLDSEYVAGFLEQGGCPGRTPYKGVFALLPGHCLVASRTGSRVVPFWRPPVNRPVRYRREGDYEEHLRELFQEAVRCRLPSDSPVLLELSGGLDSSSVVCVARQLIEGGAVKPSRVVTLSYEHEDSLDKPYYTAIEKACGFERVHLSTSEYRFLAETDTGDASPEFWVQLHTGVAQVARQFGATYVVTGTLGDLVMGNWWDDSSQLSGLIRKGAIKSALKQSSAWSKALRIPMTDILWRSLLSCLPAALIRKKTELFTDGPELRNPSEDLLTKAFRAQVGREKSMFSRSWMDAPPERRKYIRALTETLELRRLQPPEPLIDLAYTSPYAHRPLVEYMLSVPPEIVCQPGEPRRLMRRAFHAFWPPELRMRRSKDSFGGVFLTALAQLAPVLSGNIDRLEVVARGYIDPARLHTQLNRLRYSLPSNAIQLRHVILFELWLRRANADGLWD